MYCGGRKVINVSIRGKRVPGLNHIGVLDYVMYILGLDFELCREPERESEIWTHWGKSLRGKFIFQILILSCTCEGIYQSWSIACLEKKMDVCLKIVVLSSLQSVPPEWNGWNLSQDVRTNHTPKQSNMQSAPTLEPSLPSRKSNTTNCAYIRQMAQGDL